MCVISPFINRNLLCAICFYLGVGALSDAGAFNAAAEVLVTSISLSMLLLFSLDYSALHTCSADKRATFGRLLNDHSTTIHVSEP